MSVHVQKTESAAGHHLSDSKKGIGVLPKSKDIIISTGNDIPGYDIIEILGLVYGITVRSRNVGTLIGAGLKSLAGGEVSALTTNMVRCRDESMDRLISGVHQVGGNAVYAFRFDVSSPEPGWTEVCCYGTAVTAVPKESKYTSH